MGGGDPRHLSAAALAGDGTAIVARGRAPLSYAELRRDVGACARELASKGAGPGALVAVIEPDPILALCACLGTWSTGAALLPIDARTPAPAIARLLSIARPSVVVDRSVAAVTGGRALDPRAALILFTSGSSAEPKGVVLGAAGIAANVRAILAYLPVTEARVVALASPLTYSYGLIGQALTTLSAAATLAIVPGAAFVDERLETLRALGVRGLSSVPTTLRSLARVLVERGETLDLRFVASAGAALDASSASVLRAAFPSAELFNQYGLTEASPRVAAVSSRDPTFASGAVGKPIQGMAVEVRGGEIFVRGPSVMLGYLDDPGGTEDVLGEDGWLATRDLGHLDGEGNLFVTGRRDGVVKYGGERISLEEVAAAIRRAPRVQDACVLAVPHEETGVTLWAFVEGGEGIVASVRAFLRAEVPPSRRPAQVIALPALPRNSHGKIALDALRTMTRRKTDDT